MKKLLLSAGIGVLAGVALVGCGKDNVIYVQAETHQLPHYEKAIERAKEAHPEWDIQIKEVGAFEHLETLKKTAATNEDVADVFVFPMDGAKETYNSNYVLDFDANALATKIGGYSSVVPESFKTLLSENGNYYGIPSNIETMFGWVNTANAEKNGVVKNAEGKYELTALKAVDLQQPVFNGWNAASFLLADPDYNMLSKSEDGTFASTFTGEYSALTESQKTIFDWLYNQYASNNGAFWDTTSGYSYIENSFATTNANIENSGTQSITINGPWATAGFLDKTNKGDLELIAISDITIGGKPLSHWMNGWAFGINSRNDGNTEKIEVAQTIIAEILNTKYADTYFLNGGKVSPFVESSVYQGMSSLDEITKQVIDKTMVSFKGSTPQVTFTEYKQVWGKWQNAVLSWKTEGAGVNSAEAAYNKVKASFESFVNGLNK